MTARSRSVVRRNEDYAQDGRIVYSGTTWTNSDGAYDFNTGEQLVSRFMLDIPKGATITSATWSFEYGQKDGAQTGSVTFNLGLEGVDNSDRFPEANGTTAARLFNGNPYLNVVINYPGGSTPGADICSTNVTSLIQTQINRDGWEPGNYVTMIHETTAKSGTQLSLVQRNNDFAGGQQQLDVTYTVDDERPDVWDVNASVSQSPETTLGPGPSSLMAQSFYGSRADGTTFSLVVPPAAPSASAGLGTKSIKVQANPPTDGTQDTRAFGGYLYEEASVGEWVSWTGWFYNPSGNIGDFSGELVYIGGGSRYTERGVWVPFVTNPWLVVDDAGSAAVETKRALWCSVDLTHCKRSDGTNAYFYVDGLTLIRSRERVPQMFPFTGRTTPTAYRVPIHTGGSAGDRGASMRRRARQVYTLDGTVARPRDRWARPQLTELYPHPVLVPGDTRKPSVAAGIEPGTVGAGASIAKNISWGGRTWWRVSSTTAGHGLRLNVPLSRITSGSSYRCAWLVANDGASAVSVAVDWCDTTSTTVTVQPGEERVIVAEGARSPYDATYRFTDCVLSAANTSILVRPQETRVVATTGWSPPVS